MKQQLISEFVRCISQSILGMLGLSCYILADTFFIARWLGADGLAALNLAIPVYSLIHGCGLMAGVGGGTLYTLARSRGDVQQGNAAFTLSLLCGGMLSVLFVLAGACCSGEIAALLGAQGTAFAMSRTYLRMILLCSPLFLLNEILLAFVRNSGASGLAMAGMLAGSFSNILLDYVFIYSFRWGMFGAVFATCLAPVISLAVLSVFFLKRRNCFHPVKIHPDFRLSGKLLAAGFPSLVTELSSGIVMIIYNLLMLRFAGNTGVAAYGIIANISLVVIAVFTGIAQGSQPLMSRYFGKGERENLRLTRRYALLTASALALLIYGVLLLATQPVAGVFNSEGDARLQTLAVQGLRLYFLGTLPAGLNLVLCMYCICADRPAAGNAVSMLRGLLLIIPLSFVLAACAGINGLWLAFPVTEGLSFVTAVWLCRTKQAGGEQH